MWSDFPRRRLSIRDYTRDHIQLATVRSYLFVFTSSILEMAAQIFEFFCSYEVTKLSGFLRFCLHIERLRVTSFSLGRPYFRVAKLQPFVWQRQNKPFANLVTALIAVIGWLYIYYMVDTSPYVVTISDYCF